MVSFIVIGRNESWRLEKCLGAVRRVAPAELAQPFEIIYVDSRSTDGSIALAAQYADKVFLIEGDCNAAIGRNIGAKEATGDILFFLDGDMELRTGVLPTLFNETGGLKSPYMAGTVYDILFDNDWQQKEERPRKGLTGGLFVVEKDIWEEVGGMDSRFRISEDYDFCFRAYRSGFEIQKTGSLWVNHYTRYYAVRNSMVPLHRYGAMLARKHFFNGYAQHYLCSRFYSAYVLFASVILSLALMSPYVLIPYTLLLAYRSMRVIRRTSVRLNWVKVLFERFRKDCLFVYAFFMFHPTMPELKYRCER